MKNILGSILAAMFLLGCAPHTKVIDLTTNTRVANSTESTVSGEQINQTNEPSKQSRTERTHDFTK